MNNLIPFRRSERKPEAGEPNKEARRPMRIEIDLPAPMADKLTICAGYACKSPTQWARDALAAVLQMGGI